MGKLARVGVVGPGWIWREEHIRGYMATDHGYVAGFFDVNKSVAENAREIHANLVARRLKGTRSVDERKLCEKATGARAYDDLAEMLADVDCIDIATPPPFHLHYTRMAFEAGKSVLCEKPLARTFHDLGDLPNLHERVRDQVKFCLFTQYQTNPIFQKGRELVESGLVGEVKRVNAYVGTRDLGHTTSKEFFWNPKLSGGGALSDMGPHAFSVMWYWLQGAGDFRPVTVQAESLATRVPVRTIAGEPGRRIQVEDDAVLLVEWEDSGGHRCEGRLEAAWGPLTAVGPKAGKYGIYFEVEGTEGTLQFPNGTLGVLRKPKFHVGVVVYFRVTRPDGRVEKVKMPMPRKHIESEVMVDQFLKAVARDESTVNGFDYGVDMTKVIGAGYLSEKQGRVPVTLEEFEAFCSEVAEENAGAEDVGYEVVKALLDIPG
ncbi:MAG: Gfo/Idh/MocA family protein [Promethearchaeota archaeon]